MTRTLSTRGPSLGGTFWEASQAFPDRLALDVAGRELTYATLADLAARIARVLLEATRPAPVLGAVMAARSECAFGGVLGTLISGAGYVPLNPKFPAQRTAHMLAVSGSTTLIVGGECAHQLPELLPSIDRSLLVLLPTFDDIDELAKLHPRHRFVSARELDTATPLAAPEPVDPASIAYLLFTSGSTGEPKGVMVSHANVLAFLNAVWRRYDVRCEDRFSQTFDLTFDLSVFDQFVCWGKGASLHCLPADSLLVPDSYIRDHALTIWFSVPSVGMMLRKLRRLKSDAFPTLRWSLFCGERLPMEVASAWQDAAPKSVVENLYGPTEATIACTVHRWENSSPAACVDGTVPIGVPLPGHTVAVVDDQLGLVSIGDKGELCVKGPQVTHGYWNDLEKTRARFVSMPWYAGPDNLWYRTGDVAFVDGRGELIHSGRNDDQIKLRGFRIELPEIEHLIRQVASTSFVVVLPYPSDAHGPTGLTAVVAGTVCTEEQIIAGTRAALPDYMVPGSVAPARATVKRERQDRSQRHPRDGAGARHQVKLVGGEIDSEALLGLEYLASEPYARFVYDTAEHARSIARLIWERGVGEFAPPYGRLAIDDDGHPLGMIAFLDRAQLSAARMSAARALVQTRSIDPEGAVRERLLLAGATLLLVGDEDLYLSRVAVSPEHRGHGIAHWMLAEYERAGLAGGFGRLVLEVSPVHSQAIQLYKRMGFEQVGVRHAEAEDRVLDYLHLAKSIR